uniref:ATP synthase F1 subunit epsilon n=1 Tax=Anopheles minimus TaxID=112268 RepID=A0A182WIJ2_9DIPT
MVAWRAAGLNYVNYSNIAARLLRKALKPPLRAQAARREDSHIKLTKWQNGKPYRDIHKHTRKLQLNEARYCIPPANSSQLSTISE